MSSIAVNAITDANAGNTATINAVTPNVNNVVGKNRIINGNMVIDQRNAGASITPVTGAYTLDRWHTFQSVASKFSVQQNAGAVTLPVGFTNYLGVTSLSAYSVLTADFYLLRQNIEGFNFADLSWGTPSAKTVTLSFQVYSSLTGTFGGSLSNSAFDRSYPFTYSIPVANTWTTISITIAGDTTGTWVGATNYTGLSVTFGLGVGTTYSGTAGSWSGSTYFSATGATSVVGTSGATFYITGVQLEAGSSATEFEHRQYGTELALCQRYYQKFGGSSPYPRILMSSYTNTAYVGASFPYVTSMRATPTGAFVGTWVNQNTLVGSNSIQTGPEGFLLYTQSSSTVIIAGLYPSATGFITLSSEL